MPHHKCNQNSAVSKGVCKLLQSISRIVSFHPFASKQMPFPTVEDHLLLKLKPTKIS